MDIHPEEEISILTLPPAQTGVFGTKIPSSVAFAIGLLLFLLPFAELKCTDMDRGESFDIGKSKLAVNSGLGLAIGSKWQSDLGRYGMGNFFGDNETMKELNTGKPNVYAIIALGLAIIGLGLSFSNGKLGTTINIATGLLGAAALIALMIDLKKKASNAIPPNENIEVQKYFSLNFTPWFYIAIAIFLTAAFFSFRRMQLATKPSAS